MNKRTKEILRMRKNRYKLREIGEKFGISKGRVWQILQLEKYNTKENKINSEKSVVVKPQKKISPVLIQS